MNRRTFLPLFCTGVVQARDWPQWRGPNRDGVATDVAVPAKWPAQLKRVWKVQAGEGHASPLVIGSRVYVFARNSEQETLSCLDLATGKQIWQQGYAAPYQMNSAATSHGKGPKSTPLIAGGAIYTLGIDGIVSSWTMDGKLRWRQESTKLHKAGSPLFGAAMSPVLENGRLIVHLGGHDNGALTALDAATGRAVWTWTGDGPGYGSPIVGDFGGVRQVIAMAQSSVAAVSAADGKLLWRVPLKTPYDQNSVTPLIHNGLVIVSGLSNPTTALRPRAQGAPEVAWENKAVSMYMNSPVLAGGVLFGMSNRNKGEFFALDPATGKALWTSPPRQAENAAMVAAGGKIFALKNDAELLIFDAARDAFRLTAKYTVADSATWAHPALLGSRIVVKDVDSVALWSAES